MKKIINFWLFLLFAPYVWSAGSFALEGHSPNGSYSSFPCYLVGHNDTLVFSGASCMAYYIDDVLISKAPDASVITKIRYETNKLSIGQFHKFHFHTGSVNGQTIYIIINTPSQSTCSNSSKVICLWNGSTTLKRWERSHDEGSTWTNIACTSYQYTESNPSAGKVMYRALNGDNTYSDVVTITYVDAVPSSIQALPATSTKTVDESVTLEANVTDKGYSYQWKKNGTDISGAKSRTYTISKVKSSHAGNYTCYISNGCNGVTSTTAKLTVNKCTQVIDFPEIPVQTYSSGLTYTLPKTTNKGLTITYQSMNTSVATVSGNVLTIKAPGTAIISATQVGNADYLEATQVSRTLTVNKRSQVITFGELPEKTYEDLPFTLPQKTNEGLSISYRSTNTSVATISGNTVTIVKPGTTDIIASQAGDATHYAAAEVSRTLVVKKAAQEITFAALASKTYGDAPFALNQVSNKNLTISYTSSDASVTSISGNMVTIHKPGTVTITASQPGNAYYLAATSVSQTLTIKKANQSINLSALESRPYGSADFALPAQTDKGQTITYVSSNTEVATINGNIVHITGAGTTEITATQEGNEYYNAAPTESQALTITKAYQTISFPQLPECVYGQAPITLNATVNSNAEVEYESSDYSVAQINGNQLSIVGAGQCYITASAAGNKNYYTATPVERTLVVAKAPQVITFAPLENEYTYGDAPIALVATSNTGNVTFASSNPAKLMIVGTNAIINGAGTYTITASLDEDANYLATSTSQEITVNKANLTLTANNASRVYGEANPEFTYTYKGFVNGDTKTDITATIQVSSEANLTSPVGTYEIVATATTDDNYAIVCKKGVLSIEKAALTISTQPSSREYGEDNPDFAYSYSGFKNNESNAVLNSQPQAYTTAKKTSSAGTYPIYISGATANNYTISYGECFLTITKAPLTITARNATRKRYESNPSFELDYEGFKLDDTSADLDKLPTINCSATLDSPVGTYPIILENDGYATNYEYILVNGILTVEKRFHSISAIIDEAKGVITCPAQAEYLDEVSLLVTPNYGYHFTQWTDGVTDNPRTFVLTQDTTFSAELEKNTYQVTISSSNAEWGTTAGMAEALYLDEVQISATANYGYHFTQWNDGVAVNPRNVVITRDTTFTAYFSKNTYTVTVASFNSNWGTTSGTGNVLYNENVTITAIANDGYYFTQWSDGITANPRNVLVTNDTTFIAEFAPYTIYIADETSITEDTLLAYATTDNLNYEEIIALPVFENSNVVINGTQNTNWGWMVQISMSNGSYSQNKVLNIVKCPEYSWIRATLTGRNTCIKSGRNYLFEDATVNSLNGQKNETDVHGLTGWKLERSGNYIAIALQNESFAAGDLVKIYTTRNSDVTGKDGYLHLYSDMGNTPLVNIEEHAEPGVHSVVLGNEANGIKSIYLYRTENDMNPYVAYLEVIRGKNFRYTVGCDNTQGKVIQSQGGASIFSKITIEAIPNYGYHFTQWTDGVTDNPRTFVLTQDTTFSAMFAIDRAGKCGNDSLLTWQYNPSTKTLSISGNGAFVKNIQCGAEARPNLERVIIGEGVTIINSHAFDDCPNITTIVWNAINGGNYTICPFPATISTVTFGDYVEHIPAHLCNGLSKISSIVLPSSVQTIGDYAFANINNRAINNLVLPSEISSIGAYAFSNNTYIEQIDFGNSLRQIGTYAFNNCSRVMKMTCLAEVTPDVDAYGLTSISSQAELYVLSSALRKYQVDANWSRFLLKELGATEITTTEDVTVEPGENIATFTWATNDDAASYTIEITKEGVVFCTLIFNANGQLTGIAFAPSRNGTPHAPAATKTSNGLQFTVTGLNSNTQYGYSVTAKDSSDDTIVSYSGEFTTTGETQGIGDISSSLQGGDRGGLILRDGQIFILRGEKIYTVTGQEVK